MSEILQHREAGVLTLTFNRLDKKNAITTAMYTRLAEERATWPTWVWILARPA